jgi:hypothetical protein
MRSIVDQISSASIPWQLAQALHVIEIFRSTGGALDLHEMPTLANGNVRELTLPGVLKSLQDTQEIRRHPIILSDGRVPRAR